MYYTFVTKVLSGFVNSILLVFIAVSILLESMERFLEPPEVSTGNLIGTAVVGERSSRLL
jgi:zinc transporter 5/7